MIESIQTIDIDEIVQHCIAGFHGHGLSDEAISIFAYEATDWTISKKLVLNDQIAGFYLLHEGSINDWATERRSWIADHAGCDSAAVYDHCRIIEDTSRYATKKGVEGIVLMVLPEYRCGGYGKTLRDLPRMMGYDYIFGEHFKNPDILHHWLKHRRLIAECDGLWVTLQDFV